MSKVERVTLVWTSLYFVSVLLMLISSIDQEEQIEKLQTENQEFYCLAKECINYAIEAESINKRMLNHVYRMQLISGIKNPDSIFSQRKKIENYVDVKKINNHKFK